jgi:hypothetical protein
MDLTAMLKTTGAQAAAPETNTASSDPQPIAVLHWGAERGKLIGAIADPAIAADFRCEAMHQASPKALLIGIESADKTRSAACVAIHRPAQNGGGHYEGTFRGDAELIRAFAGEWTKPDGTKIVGSVGVSSFTVARNETVWSIWRAGEMRSNGGGTAVIPADASFSQILSVMKAVRAQSAGSRDRRPAFLRRSVGYTLAE